MFLQCRAGAGQLCLGLASTHPCNDPGMYVVSFIPAGTDPRIPGVPGQRKAGQRLLLLLTQDEHFGSEGTSLPSCSELRLDAAVVVAIRSMAAPPCFPQSSPSSLPPVPGHFPSRLLHPAV